MAGPGRAQRESRTLARNFVINTSWKLFLTYRIALAGFVTALSIVRGPLPARRRLSFNPVRPVN